MALDLLARHQAQVDSEHDCFTTESSSLSDIYEQMWGATNQIKRIELDDIRHYRTADGKGQPRHIDDTRVDRIFASAQENGQLQPIIVRKTDDEEQKYEILCGHHRYEAFKKLGWNSLDAIIVECNDNKAFKILAESNLEELSPSEQGEIYAGYLKMRGVDEEARTVLEIARKFNVSRKTIYRYVNLLKLIPELRIAIDNKLIPIAKAEKLINNLTEWQQNAFAEYIDLYGEKVSPKNIDKLCVYANTSTSFDSDDLYELFHSTEAEAHEPKEDTTTLYNVIAVTYPSLAGLSKAEYDEIILSLLAEYTMENNY